MGQKKPYLFYFEEAVGAWIPAPDDISGIVDVDGQLENGETMEIHFKRVDLSRAEYAALPDGD